MAPGRYRRGEMTTRYAQTPKNVDGWAGKPARGRGTAHRIVNERTPS